jgi:hypothetical protein
MDTNEIIDALGGTAEVARACEVTASAVSQWKEHGRIPHARLMYLRLLRPEVFGGERLVRDNDKAEA